MKIRSKFKDYYDFVGQIYYSDDPMQKIWERKAESVDEKADDARRIFLGGDGWNRVLLCIADQTFNILVQTHKEVTWIGKDRYVREWPVYSTQTTFDWTNFNTDNAAHQRDAKRYKKWAENWEVELPHSVYKTPEYFRNLQFKYKSPIITFTKTTTEINSKLADFSIQRILDPHLLYQDLERWFTDGKFDAPPPEANTNKNKILAHGFDILKSFRHRK